MRLVTTLAVVTISSAAYAETLTAPDPDEYTGPDTGTIALGSAPAEVTFERIALVTRDGTAKLTLALSSVNTTPTDLVLPIDLPHHASVRGLVIREHETRVVATPVAAELGQRYYESNIIHMRDPALVETDAPDHVLLHVYPLARGTPAVVELTIALPPISTLVVDPGPRVVRRFDLDDGVRASHLTRVRTPQSVEVARAAQQAAATAQLVDETTSLYAGPIATRPVPTVIVDQPIEPLPAGSTQPREAALRRCYAIAVRNDPTLAGPLKVDLSIAPDGKLTRALADGLDGDREATDCVRHAVASWQFQPGDSSIEIAYAIELRR